MHKYYVPLFMQMIFFDEVFRTFEPLSCWIGSQEISFCLFAQETLQNFLIQLLQFPKQIKYEL